MAQQAVYNAPPNISYSSNFHSTFPINEDVTRIEKMVKKKTDSKGIRVAEYFGDFDPLRSGCITKDQFRRSMDHHLGVSLSDREYDLLTSKYASDPNRVNYKSFVDQLEKELDGPSSHSSDWEPQRELTQFDDKAKRLMRMCAKYYKNRGIRVKTCYQDFDRHNMGYVTFSQFHRSFPGPPEVKDSEISCIAEYYLDHDSGLYNYLKFNSDIEVFWENEARIKKTNEHFGISSQSEESRSLQEILDIIMTIVFKNGIRTTEFFCDHDKLKSGVITENQFVCGLLLCLGQNSQLSQTDIEKVVKSYQLSDGRIYYKDFCDLMENAFNASDLEQNPTHVIHRPLQGELHKELKSLDSEEELLLEKVLVKLRIEVKKRRLLLHPFFKDFDRSKAYTRCVTKSQFQRVIDFVNLPITSNEMKLIMKKFEDPCGRDILYCAFIQSIDGEYTGRVVEVEPTNDTTQINSDMSTCCSLSESSSLCVDLSQLMADIQSHVKRNRIRTCEYFEDFDSLRSGSISTFKFRQGLSSLGFPNLSTPQFIALYEKYAHPKFPNSVAWKSFVSDVDKVFRDPMAEERVNLAREISTTCDYSKQVVHHENHQLLKVMERLKQKTSQRRILMKPCFQDFDRHNMGYITRSQFRQCLAYLELAVSEEEMILIESAYSSDKGFKYLEFLRELEPPTFTDKKFDQRLETLVRDKLRIEEASQRSLNIIELEQLAVATMSKIRIKVSKERVRVIDFMIDYDKLRSGRIPVPSFIRALDLCGFKLTNEEVKSLVERYKSVKDPDYVEYSQFSDDIECIFTVKDLEKMPTMEVQQLVTPEEVDLNQLTPEEEKVFVDAIQKLAKRVRARRIQLFSLFEDYDSVNIGSVTKSQFRRVLNELELSGLLSDYEFTVLYKKFSVKVGGRVDIYYLAFCAIVDGYASSGGQS